MSKRRNKKGKKFWWQNEESSSGKDLWGNDAETQFPNTTRQHSERMRDHDIYTYDEDTVESPYKFDYGWDRKLNEGTSADGKKVDVYEGSRNDFTKGYGSWQGYDSYKTQKLSYKYVQQMANALSAQYKITVQVGNNWKVDLKKKTLTYNPSSLVYGPKSELLATLMHEIGKLRYSEHPDTVKEKYLAAYGTPAVETLSIFEDIRVDYWMLKQYEGATEIYESAIPAVDKRVKEYREASKLFRQIAIEQIVQVFQNCLRDAEAYGKKTGMNPQQFLEQNLYNLFGEKDPDEVNRKIKDIQEEYANSGSIYDYCGEMLRVMYDSDSGQSGFDNIRKKVTDTEDSVNRIRKLMTTQKTADVLSKEVYPFVEDLLRDFNRDNEKIRNAFPHMPEASRELLANAINQNFNYANHKNGRVNTDSDGNSSVRSSGPTEDIVPKEWTTGEYAPIKDSVLPEIRQLVQRLMFLRREEISQKHEGDQRRGKLNTKKLYKSAVGNRRVFKKLLPNSNTVQSFAFSIVLDTSGSMSDRNRIVHATRALTIFSEVFKKMDIPFEIIDFSSDARHVKKFTDQFDKDVQKKLVGLLKCADGGTNLDRGLKKMQLEKQEQKNKVCIVLSDGGVGDIKYFDAQFFEPMQKRGVISVGFGIECEKSMAQLCMGNSKVLENASLLPVEFSNLLKSLIKKK